MDYELYSFDSVAEEFVAILYVMLTDEDGIFASINVVVLRNVD